MAEQPRATPRERDLDHHKTRMQEVGYCRVATLSLADCIEIVSDLGMDPRECFIDVSGWLYKRDCPRG